MSLTEILTFAGFFKMKSVSRSIDAELSWYVFGSVLKGQSSPSDIDVLCVTPDSSVSIQVYHCCHDCLMKAPIHLRVLTKKQEKVLKFIETVAAMKL